MWGKVKETGRGTVDRESGKQKPREEKKNTFKGKTQTGRLSV